MQQDRVELGKQYKALKEEIAKDLSTIRNEKLTKLYKMAQELKGEKLPFEEHLFGLLFQDLETYMDKWAWGFMSFVFESRIKIINSHIDNLFAKKREQNLG